MPRSIGSILVTVAMGLVGVTPPVTAQGGKIDACSLITKDDAVTALGASVGPAESTAERTVGPGGTVAGCRYATANGRHVQLTLTRTAENGMAAAVAECDGKSKDGLAGVGDMACWYSPKHKELRATKGTTMVIVELKGIDEPTEPATALMKKVLARLR